MAQHDFVIDNQTFPNFRTDLNNAWSAIVSQSRVDVVCDGSYPFCYLSEGRVLGDLTTFVFQS